MRNIRSEIWRRSFALGCRFSVNKFSFVLQTERYGRKSESKVETLTVSDIWFYYFRTSIIFFFEFFCHIVRVKLSTLSAQMYGLSTTNLVQFYYLQSFSSLSSFERFCVKSFKSIFLQTELV